MTSVGPVGRLGRWTADHTRLVVLSWGLLAVALGIFAPRAEHVAPDRPVAVGGEPEPEGVRANALRQVPLGADRAARPHLVDVCLAFRHVRVVVGREFDVDGIDQ